jgi:hypothetical protein
LLSQVDQKFFPPAPPPHLVQVVIECAQRRIEVSAQNVIDG